MSRIHLLAHGLINQIAAGEIIERPASVVKEIVENAIDAGATEIDIEIEDAGGKLIRIRDNGCGIHPDDLLLAFTTHATSKIATFADLERVNTLGFRGEALPSIASVSKATLTSHAAGQKLAYCVTPHLSREIIPAAHPYGTTVEIRDLFYNTPARKKFLKSERTERFHIIQLIQRFALSHHDIKITLSNYGKRMLKYGGNTVAERIAAVMGKDLLEQSVPVDAQTEDMRLWGRVGFPTYSHTQPDKQHFFVNARMIRDKMIVHAIRQAYQDVLYHGRHPIFVLYLEISPDLVDVNAHPQKHEVRFREMQMTHDFIYTTLNDALRSQRPQLSTASTIPATEKKQYPSSAKHPHHHLTVPQNIRNRSAASPLVEHNHDAPKALNETQAYYRWAKTLKPPTKDAGENNTDTIQNICVEHPLGYAVGQIHGAFILAQNTQGMVIVDMHAAHERILYERLKALLRAKDTEVQHLLMPQSMEINLIYREIIEQHRDWFSKLGFELTLSGKHLLIHSIPALLKHVPPAEMLGNVLQELAEYSSGTAVSRLEDIVLSCLSCHKAVRVNDKLSIAEMNKLLRDIETTPASGQCNHGRPTWTQLTMTELDALFMRGQ